MVDCRSVLLAAESTLWPALVLQPTRQVSPTTSAESIPDIECYFPFNQGS
ncbi:unnamed protein product [Staurois parvus]|uniref:Uncharacterized protein n=1 Tax=Staurois parvus TaxID=386267 RepID=A0ABN9EHJ4_9NEOB|nr:unnamed protein product [Staurois parvus]